MFKLPVILSAPEVRTIIRKVPLLDHRVALTTIYSCGLRLGEALNLEVGDIASKRMFLHLRAGNRQLQLLPNGRLRWPFRHSGTGAWRHLELQPFEFIRRFLQHVLPPNFHRVRRFGWLHPAGRAKLKRVRALLKIPLPLSTAEQAAWQVPAPNPPASATAAPQPQLPKPGTLYCPRCGQTLVLIGQWHPEQNGATTAVRRTTRPP